MMTPHITVANDPDGVMLRLKERWIVLPVAMARELAQALTEAADQHDPLGVTPLPEVKPAGDPIK